VSVLPLEFPSAVILVSAGRDLCSLEHLHRQQPRVILKSALGVHFHHVQQATMYCKGMVLFCPQHRKSVWKRREVCMKARFPESREASKCNSNGAQTADFHLSRSGLFKHDPRGTSKDSTETRFLLFLHTVQKGPALQPPTRGHFRGSGSRLSAAR
jgi:hypothetical protein